MCHFRAECQASGKSSAKTRVLFVLFCFLTPLWFSSWVFAQDLKTTSYLRIAVENQVQTLDPLKVQSGAEIQLLENIVEPLLRVDRKTGKILQGAAKSYEIKDEGKRILFHLREDLFFSNGEKIEAKDFIYAWMRLIDPLERSWFAHHLAAIKGFSQSLDGAILEPNAYGLKAKSPLELEVTLDYPDSGILWVFAHPIMAALPRKVVEKNPQTWQKPKTWVGSGPYLLQSWTSVQMVFVKNPHHRWAPRLQIGKVQVRFVDQPSEGLDLFLKGQLDLFGTRDFFLDDAQWMGIQNRKELHFQPDLRTIFLRLNSRSGPLSSKKLREVFALGMDRSLLDSTLMRKTLRITSSLLPEGLRGYEPAQGYLFSLSGAKSVLMDLGVCDSGHLPICRIRPGLRLLHRGAIWQKKMALTLEAYWKQKLSLEGIRIDEDAGASFEVKIKNHDYDFVIDDVAVESVRPFALLEAFQSKMPTAGSFQNQEFDQLLFLGSRAKSSDEAHTYYRRAEALLLQDAVVVPLFQVLTPILVHERVKGWEANVWDRHPWGLLRLQD